MQVSTDTEACPHPQNIQAPCELPSVKGLGLKAMCAQLPRSDSDTTFNPLTDELKRRKVHGEMNSRAMIYQANYDLIETDYSWL